MVDVVDVGDMHSCAHVLHIMDPVLKSHSATWLAYSMQTQTDECKPLGQVHFGDDACHCTLVIQVSSVP